MTPGARAQGWRRLALVLAGVLVADQATKAILVGEVDPGERVEVLPFLDLVHVMNEGVAFGFLGEGSRGVVLAFTVAALLLLTVWFARDPQRPWSWLAIGLLAGGALGNLADRAREGAVVDFIDPIAWPAFNLADAAIVIGVLGLLYVAEVHR